LQDSMGNVWNQMSRLGSTKLEVVSKTDKEIKVKIGGILFDFNKAELKPKMFYKLQKVADIMQAYKVDKVKLLIEGHTDDVGSQTYNLKLSDRRSKMVMRYLVEEESVPSVIMQTKGYGKKKPRYKGKSEEIRSKNRRVEVTISLLL